MHFFSGLSEKKSNYLEFGDSLVLEPSRRPNQMITPASPIVPIAPPSSPFVPIAPLRPPSSPITPRRPTEPKLTDPQWFSDSFPVS